MTSHSVFSRACLSVLVVLGVLLPGCRYTTEWYGLSEEQQAIHDALFYLRVAPNGYNVAVHIDLANPVIKPCVILFSTATVSTVLRGAR